MAVRQAPILYRKVQAGDFDSEGDPIKFGNTYYLEKLEPNAAGSVLSAGDDEKITLDFCKQPINQGFGSLDALTRIKMADGSDVDVAHRTRANMITDAWTFTNPNMPRDDAVHLLRFLKKVGNHQRIRADDPDGNVIYGKIEGQVQVEWNIRYYNITFTVRQEPGVTAL